MNAPKTDERETLEPRFVRLPAAARVLAISRASIYRLVKDGKIPHVRFGESVRIPKAWLDAQ